LRGVSSAENVEQHYLSELNPLLAIVVGEGNRLAELGMSRSRNILELSVRMDRFRGASANLLAHFEAHPAPAGLESFVTGLRTHLAAAEDAIESSIGAIQSFDWDALAVAVSTFSDAVEAIESLSDQYVQ